MEHDFLIEEIDGITIGSTSTLVMAANEARKFASLINDSDEEIYIALGVAAEMNKGRRINRRGGTLTISGGAPFRGVIYAICSSGSKNLCTAEA